MDISRTRARSPQEESRAYRRTSRLEDEHDQESRRNNRRPDVYDSSDRDDRRRRSVRRDSRERQEEKAYRRRKDRERSDSADRRRHRDRGASDRESRRPDESERRHSDRRRRKSVDYERDEGRDARRRNPSMLEEDIAGETRVVKRRDRSRSPLRDPVRSRRPLPSQLSAYQGLSEAGNQEGPVEKQRPNFGNSGKLAAETNTVTGTDIVLKYNEPPDARKPPASQAWRLFVFKGADTLDQVDLHGRSCWLFGRERAVTDYPVEHPSCSKQHAVIQFRYTEKRNEFGDKTGRVKPYIIDLESSNGTKVNGESIPDRRYFELKSNDVVNFGESSRDYVIMLPSK